MITLSSLGQNRIWTGWSAVKAELVGLVLQAVDGTKIPALASTDGGWSKEKMQQMLAALDAELTQTEKELEQEKPAEQSSASACLRNWRIAKPCEWP
jgi:hypothetical protein